MLDLKKLDTLKQLLVDAKDFTDVYGYFMEHFGSEPAFAMLGEPFTDQNFVKVLAQVGTQLLGKKTRLMEAYLVRLAEQRFVHGAITFGHHLGNVIYFEDIEKGLAGFGGMNSKGPSDLVRFTLVQLPGGGRKLMLN